MRLPAGCEDGSGKVVLCQRAVYGLRQAGRQWRFRLSKVLLQKSGMEQNKADARLCIVRYWTVRLSSLYVFMLTT